MEKALEGFPQGQGQLAEGEVLAESLGWQCGTLGLLCLVVAAWALGLKDVPKFRLSVFGGALALAVVLIRYEVRRRKNRTVLAFRGGRIGVYRKGALAMVLEPGQLTYFHFNYMNTVYFILAPLVFGLLGLLPWMDFFKDPGAKAPVLDMLEGLTVALCGLSSAASSIWVRHRWLTLRLPPVNGWSEDLSLDRSKAARFQLETSWGNLLG
jgi:hypothetical protein